MNFLLSHLAGTIAIAVGATILIAAVTFVLLNSEDKQRVVKSTTKKEGLAKTPYDATAVEVNKEVAPTTTLDAPAIATGEEESKIVDEKTVSEPEI